MTASFVHLHTHTEYSMLDGAARIPDAVAAAVADGQPALAVTDHGNMYGVLEFYTACRSAGITPILGTEAYMALESITERPRRRGRKVDDSGGDADGGEKLYYHLTLLAETNAGYRNLIQLASKAFLDGYYYKPRMDWDMFERHSEGLIATTGCLGGVVQQALLQGDFDEALKRAGRLQDIFGRDSLFVELQDQGLALQKQCNPRLLEIARHLDAPLLATNDLHYVHQDDHLGHDALLCVQTGSLMSDPDRFKFDGDQHYLKTAAEMRMLFDELPEACDNTLWVAERAGVEIEFGSPQLPKFPLPEGFDGDDAYLRSLAFAGAAERWGGQLPEDAVDRLNYELQVISSMGFSRYFLIVWDLIRHARESGIRVGPGRGSAAGCAVAYCLRITDLDPIRYDLLFERFLNPGRRSMPDIDMDFDDRYRDEMIRYTAERYGRNHVAQIITFSTIKARAAVRDAARVLGHPYQVGDRIAKAMPPLIMGRDTPLWACLERTDRHADGYTNAAELRQMYNEDPAAKEIIGVAMKLENLRRQDSIHAAAVVITNEPLTEYLPIQRKPESGQEPGDTPVVTQYEMHGVEELGLLKMDYLGLRNLSIISDCLELIRSGSGVELDIDDIPLDDEPTFELLRRADTIGVFQLESGPIRSLIRSLAPTTFDDVAALVALYRPGPMAANMHNDYADRKNGRQEVTYLHADAEEILAETWGLCIYQESVMRIAQRFAGYTLEEADNLRKACGKKIREMIAAERERFIAGCETQGYGAKLGKKWFDIIEPFADYAFNKSHAYGYGLIAYQTAYLKANHRVEYMAALLTGAKSNQDRMGLLLADCRQQGITVRVPDVNLSDVDFTAADGQVPFGLSAVRNVGEGLVGPIVEERKGNGPYTDFYDFCQRVPLPVLNKRAIESLIKAGAFDGLGHPRRGLLTIHEQVIDQVSARRRDAELGIQTLFGGMTDMQESTGERVAVPDIEFDDRTKLRFEREMLGLYVSSHPLDGLEHLLRRQAEVTVTALVNGAVGGPAGPGGTGGGQGSGGFVTVGGIVTNVQPKLTRAGKPMAIFELEDLQTSVEVMVFPRTMVEHGHKLEDDAIVLVRGRYDDNDETPRFIAHEITAIEHSLVDERPCHLFVDAFSLADSTLTDLRDLIHRHPGDSEVFVHLGADVVRLPDSCRVNLAGGLAGELRVLFGPNCVRNG